MNKMLHLVNKSPFERNSLQSCLRLARAGSSILLIEDGVYAAISGTVHSRDVSKHLGELTFYVLGPDMSARGLDESTLTDGVNVVDYGGFVDLVVEHDVTQSWL
jgi:tRNA 2-thiouridine synthesizing protein B